MYGNNNSRGCQFLQEDVSTEGLRWGESVSLVGAGFLGAGLTVMVVGIVLGILRAGRKGLIRGHLRAPRAEGPWYVHASAAF